MSVQVASPEEAAKLLSDSILFGMAFVNEDGYRVDPTHVVLDPENGQMALDSGGAVYRPLPWDFLERSGGH